MKLTKKVISLFLALVMLCTAVPFVSAQESSVDEYVETLEQSGFHVMSTAEFAKLVEMLGEFVYFLTGVEISTYKYDLEVTGVIRDVTDALCNASGLDLAMIAENMPNLNAPAKLVNRVFRLDTTAIRTMFYQQADTYKANGADVMYTACRAIGAYMSIMKKMEVTTEKTAEKDVYKVILNVEYEDGTTESHYAGILINAKTGDCYGDKSTGMIGTGYNFNFYEAMVYTTVDCWMRNFGFCVLYDVVALSIPVVFNYITRRYRFEYDGLEWMIQMWKGNYVISNGAEIGIYNREPDKKVGSFYNCATTEQQLDMSLQVLIGDKVLLSRPMESHWWISGFALSTKVYSPASLTLKSTIQFPDMEMLEAFTDAIDNEINGDASYTVDGLKVNFVW